jgi:hypothetical protein
LTLALIGSSYDETEPQKVTHRRTGRNIKIPDSIGANSRRNNFNNGKSSGNPTVKMATSNGTINLSEGTNKNELWV